MSDKSINPLEQYILLAKSAKGAAAVALIKQVLEAPGIYVFGELLDMPNIQELQNGPHLPYWKLLNVFAFGTFADYEKDRETLPELSPPQSNKLRHLTIATLASKSKLIPYSQLLSELKLENLRQLEDVVIEVVYADVVRGKLDQKNQLLEVEYAVGRDIKLAEVPGIVTMLQQWNDGCETMLAGIQQEIVSSNQRKETSVKQRQNVEQVVASIRKNIKSHDVADEHVSMSDQASGHLMEKQSKKARPRGLRGSASTRFSQLWQKST